MVLKELVLNSLEKLGDFRIYGAAMNDEVYGENADKEVKSWAVYPEKDAQSGYYIEVVLED